MNCKPMGKRVMGKSLSSATVVKMEPLLQSAGIKQLKFIVMRERSIKQLMRMF